LASVSILVAYTSVLTQAAGSAPTSATADDDKVKVLHYARVKSDGTLISGTALSSTQVSNGRYALTFPAPIDGCAAAANSASFAGFDVSAFRIWAQISIGSTSGGAFDDGSVIVSLFGSDGSSADSSFTLLLMCP
jgi:hypothetical protein